MPEQLLGRIIRCCSDPGDVVLDPFGGSGSTLITAKKLGRRYIGFELSASYAKQTQARIDAASADAPLAGRTLSRFGQLVTALDLRPEHAVLDFGCGTGWSSEMLQRMGMDVVGVDVSPAAIDMARASASVRSQLEERARTSPLDPGIPLGELLPAEPWAPAVLQALHLERRDGRAYAPGAAPQLGDRAAAAEELEARLAAEDLVRVDDRRLAGFLEERGTLKRVGDGFAVSAALYDRGRAALETLSPITLAGFRDALGVSRRIAQLLLERFDADGITLRVGDERRLRASRRR
jgi:SAM-dependent methyltransferase